MAGYSKVYFVGSTGGFMGSDGLARPFFQIMVGDAGRQWLEPVYDAQSDRLVASAADASDRLVPKPIGDVRALVPRGPDDPVALLDAVIAFFPAFFRMCPSLAKVEAQLYGVERLDFDLGNSVPAEWPNLRAEALPRFRELAVFEADLRLLDLIDVAVRSRYEPRPRKRA